MILFIFLRGNKVVGKHEYMCGRIPVDMVVGVLAVLGYLVDLEGQVGLEFR
ncbi:hypothetical protein [Salmonella sp. s51933]|uniref:hypothetical protein n=1 Tax=Salmonella sp. s51933 TaxID=3160127 RepID=UPI003754E622